jgi:hypothetical protein
MRYVENRLELGWGDEELPESVREAVEGYNREDCFSTATLRDWLEGERTKLVAGRTAVPRFVPREEDASEELDERQKRVAELIGKLADGIPSELEARTSQQQAQWLLAQLQDWHRREDKATYWEGYQLADLDDADLLEERAGWGGLRFLERLRVERNIPVDRYGFEKQETEARAEDDLYYKGEKFGSVSAIDPVRRTIDAALSHKVIRKLLEEVVDASNEVNQPEVRCMQRSDEEEPTEDIAIAGKNEEAWAALKSGKANVVGGTSWLWTPEAAFEAVDVLFIDEAGQMGRRMCSPYHSPGRVLF